MSPPRPSPLALRRLTDPSGIAFRAEDGRQYLGLSPQKLLHPELRFPIPSSLRSVRNQADYLLLAPQAFLPAAQPLLD